jgi:uncharacterized RDD family membrane protein YckC
MTDPAGGAPTPPPSEPTPPPATPPPAGAAPPPSSWTAPQPQSQGFATAQIAAGPAPGVVYADTTMRVIAYIIDSILLFIAIFLLAIILGAIAVGFALGGGLVVGVIFAVIIAIIALLGSAFYFVYFWQTLRASPGQKMLGLETVNAADGATLTRDQAVRRWAFLFGPSVVASVFQFSGSVSSGLGSIGSLLGLVAFIYAIYLLYTVTQSPKRQGFHDVQASTVVVKRG